MRRENVNYLVVGVFVASVSLFLLYVLYKLAVHQEDTDKYYFAFKNITGIKVGTKITYGGYRIGTVRAINPIQKNKETWFRIHADVKKGWKIPSKSRPRIVAPNFLAEQQIDILEVKSKVDLLPNSEYMKEGEDETSFMTMMNDVAQEVKLVSNEKVRPLLESLNKQIDKIGDRLSVQIPMIAENTNKLVLNLNQGVEELKEFLGKENQTNVKDILQNVKTVSADLKKFSANLKKTMAENKRGINQSVIAMRKSLESISSRINSIVYNIEQTSRNFSEFSHKIRQNPGLLIGGKSPKERGVYNRR